MCLVYLILIPLIIIGLLLVSALRSLLGIILIIAAFAVGGPICGIMAIIGMGLLMLFSDGDKKKG
ncbi:MAG: hypothetical protein KBI39_03470 [Firmicutes bacterium]|nr:hypothetical protein [Candidatus Fermentithermobacillaceae bacterium]